MIAATTSRGQKFPYTFSVTFDIAPHAIEDKQKENKDEMISIFEEMLTRDLFSFWKVCYHSKDVNPYTINMDEFHAWVHRDCDYEEKQNVYLVAMAKIFGKHKLGQKSYESFFQRWYRDMVHGNTERKCLTR
jgi:hypothetical protein